MVQTQSLADRLHELSEEQPFDSYWYFKDLRTGEVLDRGGSDVIPSGSTRKTAIMMAALKAVNEGRLALDQPVTVQAEYQAGVRSCFSHLQPGFTVQFQDLIVMMIIVSDNTSTGTIADMVGLDYINDFSQSIGMVGTTHRERTPPFGLPRDFEATTVNTTTAADVGLLYDLIQQGARDHDVAKRLGGTQELCNLALDILSWQKLRGRIPSLLPEGTKVANKTGSTPRAHNDAGIVYRDDEPRFIVSVYTDNVPAETAEGIPGMAAADRFIGRLTRDCWNALS